MKGGAKAHDLNALVGQFWIITSKLQIDLEVGRVASPANIADEPTRGANNWIVSTHARFKSPVLPDWLCDPWLAPDLPHFDVVQ